jgi:ketosteroid isomerase-like protein
MATTEAQLRVILAMFDAFACLDADEFASHLTEDVVFRPSGFVTGTSEFLGREAVRRNLLELREQRQVRDKNLVRLWPLSLYVDREDETKILALARCTVIRPTSDSFDTDVAHLHTMRGSRLRRSRPGSTTRRDQAPEQSRGGAVSALDGSWNRSLREN